MQSITIPIDRTRLYEIGAFAIDAFDSSFSLSVAANLSGHDRMSSLRSPVASSLCPSDGHADACPRSAPPIDMGPRTC